MRRSPEGACCCLARCRSYGQTRSPPRRRPRWARERVAATTDCDGETIFLKSPVVRLDDRGLSPGHFELPAVGVALAQALAPGSQVRQVGAGPEYRSRNIVRGWPPPALPPASWRTCSSPSSSTVHMTFWTLMELARPQICSMSAQSLRFRVDSRDRSQLRWIPTRFSQKQAGRGGPAKYRPHHNENARRRKWPEGRGLWPFHKTSGVENDISLADLAKCIWVALDTVQPDQDGATGLKKASSADTSKPIPLIAVVESAGIGRHAFYYGIREFGVCWTLRRVQDLLQPLDTALPFDEKSNKLRLTNSLRRGIPRKPLFLPFIKVNGDLRSCQLNLL